MYENWSILKSELDKKHEEYSAVAEWCNDNQDYIIVEDGLYYKVQKYVKPKQTDEEILAEKRVIRNQYLQDSDKYVFGIDISPTI